MNRRRYIYIHAYKKLLINKKGDLLYYPFKTLYYKLSDINSQLIQLILMIHNYYDYHFQLFV